MIHNSSKISICIIVIIVLDAFGIALAAFNPQINYQGKLTDTNDVAVTDGDYNFEFKLWATSTATSSEYLKWTEICTSSDDKITVTNGLFSHLLGSVHSFSADNVDFNQTLWLEVSIAGTTTDPTSSDWETLSPRKKLGAVPAAFVAEKIGDYGTSSIAILSEDETITGAWTFNNIVSISASSSSPVLTVQQDGSGNIVEFKNATGTVFTIATSGNATLAGDFLPATTSQYDLGSSTYKWANLYAVTTTIGDTITIGTDTITGSGTTTVSVSAGKLVLNSSGNVDLGTITSGTWNAATITDAYVTSTLTISGGTIENTPIGASSPSAAVFTTATSTELIVSSTSTLGTITSGTWHGATITDAYVTSTLTISSAGSVDSTALTDGGTIGFEWVDAEVSDTLTVTSTGAVNKGALKDEGTLGFDWADSEIANALTIDSSGSVSSTALTGTIASDRLSGSYTGITGVGTLTAGTWNAATITDAYISNALTISSSGSVAGEAITDDSLDWSEFKDAMTLDTTTTISMNYPLNFDSATLYIDGAGNAVGIGTQDLSGSLFKVARTQTTTSSNSVTDTFTDINKIATTTNLDVDTTAGEVKLATTTEGGEFCTSDSDKNTTTTISEDVVYCDNSLRMWSITANVTSSATTYAWGGYGTDEPTDSCINVNGRPACNYCDNLTYAGYSNWELPSCASKTYGTGCVLYEFGMSACGWSETCGGDWNCASCTPTWDTNAQANTYWSSTEYSSNFAYNVYFNNGNVYSSIKDNDSYVRCVRGQ